MSVTVNDVAPTASLTGPTKAQVGTAQSFTASATDVSPAVQAAGFTYAWTFGDGGTGTGATPSHTFATAGTYTVTVTAKDEYGKTGTASETITIFGPPSVNAGSALTVNAESSLTFSQATESGGTAPFTYSWNFGDGSPPSGSSEPLAHVCEPGQLHGDGDCHGRQQADRNQFGRGDGQRRGADGDVDMDPPRSWQGRRRVSRPLQVM